MNHKQLDKSNQLAAFIDNNPKLFPKIPIKTSINLYGIFDCSGFVAQRQFSTSEQLADELVRNSEFLIIHLGTWLNTPDGDVIETAVGMMISPLYAPEYQLAIDGLKLAAQNQNAMGIQRAQNVVLAGLIVAVAIRLLNRS